MFSLRILEISSCGSNLVGGTVQYVPRKQAAYPARFVNQVDYAQLRLFKVFISPMVYLLDIMF